MSSSGPPSPATCLAIRESLAKGHLRLAQSAWSGIPADRRPEYAIVVAGLDDWLGYVLSLGAGMHPGTADDHIRRCRQTANLPAFVFGAPRRDLAPVLRESGCAAVATDLEEWSSPGRIPLLVIAAMGARLMPVPPAEAPSLS